MDSLAESAVNESLCYWIVESTFQLCAIIDILVILLLPNLHYLDK